MRGRCALGLRVTLGALLVAAAATAGCSILIGVSGDPVVVDEGGADMIEAGAESGDENDSANPQDAASADETDTGDAADADADDGPVE
jgi:hypothetical protein